MHIKQQLHQSIKLLDNRFKSTDKCKIQFLSQTNFFRKIHYAFPSTDMDNVVLFSLTKAGHTICFLSQHVLKQKRIAILLNCYQ